MKPLTRYFMGPVPGAFALSPALLAFPPTQASAGGRKAEKKWTVKSSNTKSGPEVAARVKSLKEHSKDVRAAFEAFEKRGRAPRVDDATLVSGSFDSPKDVALLRGAGGGFFMKAAFAQEQTSVNNGTFELILVPALVVDGEWQGTAIATRYDSYGYVVDQFTSDIVTVENYDGATKMAYEVRYDGGVPYLQHEPGMYTGFALGLTIQEHQAYLGAPPPVDLQSWQFPSPETEQQYYQQNPLQREYQREMLQQPEQVTQLKGAFYGKASFVGGASFRRASFQARSDRSASREQLRQFCGNPNGCGPSMSSMFSGNVNRWLVQTSARCGGAGVACRGNAQCTLLGCAGAAISALPALYGW
jgi:hypothetical protein